MQGAPCRHGARAAAAVGAGTAPGRGGQGPGGTGRAGPGPAVTVPRGNRAVVAESPGAEMGEQAVITPAMLAEEEQLEAAGLEKERQMLEKVSGERGQPPACRLGVCGAAPGR